MESLQVKMNDLDKWRIIEKNIPSSLSVIKSYDIKFHTLDTKECQELASMFEEKPRQSLAGMMNVYEKTIYDVQRCLQWPEINFLDEHQVSFAFFQDLEEKYEMIKVEV